MRILDPAVDSPTNSLSLFLTRAEASELRDLLDLLLSDSNIHHEHVLSEELTKELTVAIYDAEKLEGFDDRSRRLILEDK